MNRDGPILIETSDSNEISKRRRNSLFIVGLMGVGKSSVGRQVANILDYEFFDADNVVEQRAGADIPWIFDVEGEDGFREREMQVIDDLTRRDRVVVATGGGVVTRQANRKALLRGHVAYLTCPIKELLKRTSSDQRRPLLKTNPESTLRKLFRDRSPLYSKVSHASFSTQAIGIKAVANAVADWYRLTTEERK